MTDEPPLTYRTQFQSVWALNDRVVCDGDRSLPMCVTGFQFRMERSPLIECSYFHNGKQETTFVEEWRLRPYQDVEH